ncbi:hypothetical protein EC973_001812 [Apophysomyces ossiformis]|uniref:Uncharacterized protein n=1 Tax=Apophysomyces ossiformis TaxID=679940 RepID=A0A8H7BNR7_9FUNG|nr:hypothetical protein EC973_001812 [Apophysomyces ossiformis]
MSSSRSTTTPSTFNFAPTTSTGTGIVSGSANVPKKHSTAGAAVISHAIDRLQKMLNELNARINDQEFSMALHEEALRTTDRITQDISYHRTYVNANFVLTDDDKASLGNKLDFFQLEIKQCHDSLRIKRLEDENRKKEEAYNRLVSEMKQQKQCYDRLEKKLREVEKAREQLEERRITLSDPMIVQLCGGDNGKIPPLDFW